MKWLDWRNEWIDVKWLRIYDSYILNFFRKNKIRAKTRVYILYQDLQIFKTFNYDQSKAQEVSQTNQSQGPVQKLIGLRKP